MTSDLRKKAVVLLAALVVMLIAISLIKARPIETPAQIQPNKPAALVQLPVTPPPPITKTMKAVLEKSKGFSVFVSYTDDGFEPSDVSLKHGQTVRFTNNATHPLWISAVAKNGVIYPGSTDGCGQSAFDTCVAMAPHEIWEFTFDKPGVWGYRNNSEQTHTGVIRVQ